MSAAQIHDIPGYESFIKIEFIDKGWSGDVKYYIETAGGQRMLLRTSDVSEYEYKKTEYGMMGRVHELGVITSAPLGFGLCNHGKNVYSLSGWIDGKDAMEMLPLMSEAEQYALGFKSGEILRTIHTLPAPADAEPWDSWFCSEMQKRIDYYNTNPIKSSNGDKIVRFLQNNKSIIKNRPQCFNHGDFYKSNLIILPDGQIGVIDFCAYDKDYGDPWREFDQTNWGGEVDAHLWSGLIDGYFSGSQPSSEFSPPCGFFEILKYYLAYNALAVMYDAPDNQGRLEEGRLRINNVLRWYDDMSNSVPTWYLKDFYVHFVN